MIQEIMDRKLQEEQDKRKNRVRSGKISPSSLGRCFRAQYWNRMNEPVTNPPDARLLRVFAVGHLFHSFVEDLLDVDTEVKVETEDIYGFADVVGGDYVVDIKSVHSKKFWFLEKEDKVSIIERERPYFLQTACYANILGKDKCGVVFVSKDDLCIKEYFVRTETILPELNKELQTVRMYWENKQLPPAIPRCYPSYRTNKTTKTMELVGHKECEYCNYRDKCLNGISL